MKTRESEKWRTGAHLGDVGAARAERVLELRNPLLERALLCLPSRLHQRLCRSSTACSRRCRGRCRLSQPRKQPRRLLGPLCELAVRCALDRCSRAGLAFALEDPCDAREVPAEELQLLEDDSRRHLSLLLALVARRIPFPVRLLGPPLGHHGRRRSSSRALHLVLELCHLESEAPEPLEGRLVPEWGRRRVRDVLSRGGQAARWTAGSVVCLKSPWE